MQVKWYTVKPNTTTMCSSQLTYINSSRDRLCCSALARATAPVEVTQFWSRLNRKWVGSPESLEIFHLLFVQLYITIFKFYKIWHWNRQIGAGNLVELSNDLGSGCWTLKVVYEHKHAGIHKATHLSVLKLWFTFRTSASSVAPLFPILLSLRL